MDTVISPVTVVVEPCTLNTSEVLLALYILNIGSEPEVLSLNLNWVALPLLWVTSKYAPLNFNVGFVPNLKLPFTNSFSLELVEPIETVSFVESTKSVPESTLSSGNVVPIFFQEPS